MFDIAWSEMALIAAIALIVIGPKELPRVLRQVGIWTRKLRLLAGEFQRNLDDMVREAELDDVRRDIEKVSRINVDREVDNLIDPTGETKKAFDFDDVKPKPAALPATSPAAPDEPASDRPTRETPSTPDQQAPRP